jgi:hypothetical protein
VSALCSVPHRSADVIFALNYSTVETTCDDEVYNNVTYFVSPKFPAIMPSDKENCSIRIKLVSDDISQIRLDFLHFTLVSFAFLSLFPGVSSKLIFLLLLPEPAESNDGRV